MSTSNGTTRARWIALAFATALALGGLTLGCGRGCGDEAPAPGGDTPAGEGTPTRVGAGALAGSGGSTLAETELGAPGQGVRQRQSEPAVARVNGEDVTRSALEAQLATRVAAYERRGQTTDSTWRNAQRRHIVRSLVQDALLRSAIAEADITIDDDTVDAALAAEIQTNFRTEDRFAEHLRQRETTREAYRDRLRFDLELEALLGDAPPTVPSDEELRRFFEQRQERFEGVERARVATITARLGRRSNEEQIAAARARLEALVARVRGGEAFGLVAREHSDGPERYRDGDLGWIERGELALEPEIEALLFETQPVGEVGDVVRTRIGWQVFLIEARRPAGVPEFETIRNEVRDAWNRAQDQQRRERLLATLEERYAVRYLEAAWGLE